MPEVGETADVGAGLTHQSAPSNPSRIHHHSLLRTDGLVAKRNEWENADAFAHHFKTVEAKGAATRRGPHLTSC